VNVESEIRQFVNEEVLDGTTDSADPLADGLLDSLAIEQLIAFVEEQYGVVFEDDELVAENFPNLATVALLVESKMTAAAEG
jgi:acyl carrier protein